MVSDSCVDNSDIQAKRVFRYGTMGDENSIIHFANNTEYIMNVELISRSHSDTVITSTLRITAGLSSECAEGLGGKICM